MYLAWLEDYRSYTENLEDYTICKNSNLENAKLKLNMPTTNEVIQGHSGNKCKTEYVNVPKNKELEFTANTAQVGTGKTKVTGSIEGEKTTIAFNSHYVSAGLGVLNTTQVSLETIDSNKPALLRPVGDDTFFYIMMPVRLQG